MDKLTEMLYEIVTYEPYDSNLTIPELANKNKNNIIDLDLRVSNILNNLVNNPLFIDQIIQKMINDPDFANQLKPVIENIVNTDQALQAQLEQVISDYILSGAAFTTAVNQAVDSYVNTPTFITNLATALIAQPNFLTTIITSILADQGFINSTSTTLTNSVDFINNVGNKLKTNTQFLTDIKNQLVADQSFITSLGNSLSTNQAFLNSITGLVKPILLSDTQFLEQIANNVLPYIPMAETQFFPVPPQGTTNKTEWCVANPASKINGTNTTLFDLTNYNDDDLLSLTILVESSSSWPISQISINKSLTKYQWIHNNCTIEFVSDSGIVGNGTTMHGFAGMTYYSSSLIFWKIIGTNATGFGQRIEPTNSYKFYATLTRVGIVGDNEAIPPDNSTIQVIDGKLQAKQFITKTGKYFSETAQGELQTNSTILDQDLNTQAKDFRNGINEIYAKVVWSAPLATTSVANNGIQILGTDFDPATEIIKVTVNSANLDIGSTQLACIGAVFDTQDWNGVNPRETGVDGFGANTGGTNAQATLSGFQLIKNVNNYEIRLYKRGDNTVGGTTPQPLVGDIVVRKAKI